MNTATTPAQSQDLRAMLDGLQTESGTHDALARQRAALLAFGRRTSASPPLSELMLDAVSLVGEVLDAELHGIAEIEADGRTLKIQITSSGRGTAESVVEQTILDATESMAGYAVQVARPVILEDLASEGRFCDSILEALGVASGLAIPLALDGRVFGTLGVFAREPRCFTIEDSHFVETVSHMLVSSAGRYHAEAELDRVREVAEEATRQMGNLRSKLDQTRSHLEDPDRTHPIERDHGAGNRAVRKRQRPSTFKMRSPRPFESPGAGKAAEMRSSPRRAYEYQQSIAPMYGGCIPSRKDFVLVECRDISTGGLAFYMSGRPDFDHLVVALGRHPNQTFFTAKVVRAEPTERDGQRQYLVGCHFSGRIQV